MPRRAAFFALICGFLALAASVTPWTISSGLLRSSVAAQLKELYGFELSVAGRSTIAFLPVPRLKFDDITLIASDGTSVVRGGALRGDLRILPLLAARLELSDVSLSDAFIEVTFDEAGRTPWDMLVDNLRRRLQTNDAQHHVKRLVLNRANIRLQDRRTRSETTLRDIHLTAHWPTATAVLDLAGSMTWRGTAIDLTTASVRPDALLAGRSSPLKVAVTSPLAGLTLTGDLTWRDEAWLVGRAAFATRSLQDFASWTGLDLPLGSLMRSFALDGDVRIDPRGLSWPNARLTLGGDRLDGALAWRRDGERRTITGTLAADRLDLTGFVAPLARLRSPTGGWSSDGFALHASDRTDLDVRFSASTARIGSLLMEDLAANISVKPGRYEASIGRVSINKGVARGRATLASAGDGIEIKGQSSFDQLDVAALLAQLGLSRWIGGMAQGQFTFEGSGDTPADVVSHLDGRANVTIRQGELVGHGLTEALRRNEGKPAPVASKGGRTPFEQAHFNVIVTDGVAEIGDGKLTSAGLRGALRGRASLTDRTLALTASVESASATGPQPAPAILFDITGPWSDITIIPGIRSLTQRPDAADPGGSRSSSVQ